MHTQPQRQLYYQEAQRYVAYALPGTMTRLHPVS